MLTITALKKKYGLHVTTNHKDKMQGLASFSTNPLCNELCKKRCNIPGSICEKCYSVTMQHRFDNLNKCLEKNDTIKKVIIPDCDLPILFSETGMFRFEAFGDIETEIQVVNYFHMSAANQFLKCALWTKNPWIIKKAIKNYGLVKPANLVIIGSSYFINECMKDFYKKYDFIDYVFTVYTEKYARENGIVITCGGRSCASCMKCYFNSHDSYEINELLK